MSRKRTAHYSDVGLASWYGDDFHGRYTANGEIFDMNAITAAHPTLPLPCYVRVTNLRNQRSIVVRVNDRGPYVGDRVIDLSVRTAKLLGFYGQGVAKVKVEYVGRAPLAGSDDRKLEATLREGTPAAGVRVASRAGLSSRRCSIRDRSSRWVRRYRRRRSVRTGWARAPARSPPCSASAPANDGAWPKPGRTRPQHGRAADVAGFRLCARAL